MYMTFWEPFHPASFCWQATLVFLLSLAAYPSAPTSDLEVSSDDLEVGLGDPTAAQERRLRAALSDEEKLQPKHVLPINKQVSAFLPGRQYKRSATDPGRHGTVQWLG